MAAAPTPYLVALCTCPDRETAEGIAGAVVAAGLAACVNVLPGVTSVYLWQGEVQKEPEILLVMKTRADRFEQLCGEFGGPTIANGDVYTAGATKILEQRPDQVL